MRTTTRPLLLAVISFLITSVTATFPFPFPRLATSPTHELASETTAAVETLIIEHTPTPATPEHVLESTAVAVEKTAVSVVTIHNTATVVHAMTETVHIVAEPVTVEKMVHVTVKESQPPATVTKVESAQVHVVPTTLIHTALAPTTVHVTQIQIHTQVQTVESRIVDTQVEVKFETAKETIHQVQLKTVATTKVLTQMAAPVTVQSIQRETQVVHIIENQTITTTAVQTAAPVTVKSIQRETKTLHVVQPIAPVTLEKTQISTQKETHVVQSIRVETAAPEVVTARETVHVVQTAVPSIQKETVLSIQKQTETVHNVQILTHVAAVPVVSIQKETVHVVQTAAPMVIHSIQTQIVHAISTVVSTAAETLAEVIPTTTAPIHQLPLSPLPTEQLASTRNHVLSPPAHTAPVAVVQTHTVIVGGDAGLVYTPPTVNAAVGDTIRFLFMATNHTVTQSTFNNPCQSFDDSLDSGYWPNPNNTIVPPPQWDFAVSDMEPTWWFCAQGTHCSKGMVFSVNPTAEKTHEMFRNKAVGAIIGGDTAGSNSSMAAGVLPTASSKSALTLSVEGAAASATGSTFGGATDGSCQCQCLCAQAAFNAPLIETAAPSPPSAPLRPPSTFITSTRRATDSGSIPSVVASSTSSAATSAQSAVPTATAVESLPVAAERLQAPMVTIPLDNPRARFETPTPQLGGLNMGMFTDMQGGVTVTFNPS